MYSDLCTFTTRVVLLEIRKILTERPLLHILFPFILLYKCCLSYHRMQPDGIRFGYSHCAPPVLYLLVLYSELGSNFDEPQFFTPLVPTSAIPMRWMCYLWSAAPC